MRDERFYGQREIEYKIYLDELYGCDNSHTYEILKQKLRKAMSEELTPRQLYVLKLYYVDGFKIPHIAGMLGVNKSTVSRTLGRAKERLRRCLRYGAAELLDNKAVKNSGA